MERLNRSAESGDVEALYSIIAEDPYILDRIDGIPFADTPLHFAAAAGNTHFAMEMVNLKPSFARKLNSLGLSPVHLALINGHDELVRSIITTDSELVRVKAKGMVTPLHYAAQTDNVYLLADFLAECPSSIEDLTAKCESVVHIAVKNHRSSAFKVLLGWLTRSNKEEILKWKDDDGNTVLHIAAATNQTDVMKLAFRKVNINAKNLSGLTAMDILDIQGNMPEGEVGIKVRKAGAKKSSELEKGCTIKLADYLCHDLSLIELRDKYLGIFGKSQDKAIQNHLNFVIVVAALIAAAAFQAALSPPGGFWQDSNDKSELPKFNFTSISNATSTSDSRQGIYNITNIGNITAHMDAGPGDHQAGTMILGSISKAYLVLFTVLNSLAFYVSVITILIAIVGVPFFYTLATSTYFVSLTFAFAIVATWPLENEVYPWVAVAFWGLLCFFSILIYQFPLVMIFVMSKQRVEGDDSTRRQVSSSYMRRIRPYVSPKIVSCISKT